MKSIQDVIVALGAFREVVGPEVTVRSLDEEATNAAITAAQAIVDNPSHVEEALMEDVYGVEMRYSGQLNPADRESLTQLTQILEHLYLVTPS